MSRYYKFITNPDWTSYDYLNGRKLKDGDIVEVKHEDGCIKKYSVSIHKYIHHDANADHGKGWDCVHYKAVLCYHPPKPLGNNQVAIHDPVYDDTIRGRIIKGE